MIIRGGGVGLIAKGMRDFPEVPMQLIGAKALQTLAFGVEYVKVMIASEGGAKVLLDTMTQFPHEAEIQSAALGALANLSSSGMSFLVFS